MRPLALAAGLLLAAGPAAATTVELDQREIPPEYHGRWEINARLCGSSASRYRLEISAGEVAIGGTPFRVSGVSFLDDGRLGVSSDHIGRGKPWGRTDHFLLSPDGTKLTVQRGGRIAVRRRCPAGKASA